MDVAQSNADACVVKELRMETEKSKLDLSLE